MLMRRPRGWRGSAGATVTALRLSIAAGPGGQSSGRGPHAARLMAALMARRRPAQRAAGLRGWGAAGLGGRTAHLRRLWLRRRVSPPLPPAKRLAGEVGAGPTPHVGAPASPPGTPSSPPHPTPRSSVPLAPAEAEGEAAPPRPTAAPAPRPAPIGRPRGQVSAPPLGGSRCGGGTGAAGGPGGRPAPWPSPS